MHNNSRESYEKCKGDDNFKRIIHRIANFFETRTGSKLTDREVKNLMFQTGDIPENDMNMVRPKITNLIKADMLEEMGSSYDPNTRRNVRLVTWRMPKSLFGGG